MKGLGFRPFLHGMHDADRFSGMLLYSSRIRKAKERLRGSLSGKSFQFPANAFNVSPARRYVVQPSIGCAPSDR